MSNKPVMIELFSGTARMAQEFKRRGFEVITVDMDYESTIKSDVRDVHARMLPQAPSVIWASPPCTAFSVASISHYWAGGVPSDKALVGVQLLSHTLMLIMQLKPKYWFIENPVGMMRKMPIMEDLPRHTITFCAYGERRRKPTDIWTNSDVWLPRPMCSNGSSCHDPAPRGSRTGTQGLNGAYDRAALPVEFCAEIAASCVRGLGLDQASLKSFTDSG